MLDHKRALAAAISSTATSVLAQPVADNLEAAAVDKLEQALLRQLSNANTLTCVAVFPVTDAHYTPALPPDVVAAPRLFGQPGGVLNGGKPAGNDNFALSTAKIPLNATGSDSTLAFLASSRSAETEAYVELKLSYALTHVEHDIRNVPGIKLYEQSRWITFLDGSVSDADHAAPGRLFLHTGCATGAPRSRNRRGPERNADLSRQRQRDLGPAQDPELFVQLSAQPGRTGSASSPKSCSTWMLAPWPTPSWPRLPTRYLTSWRSSSPSIQPWRGSSRPICAPINGKTEASSPDVANANAAMSALETVVKGVTNAYVAWAEEKTPFGLTPAPMPRVAYTFDNPPRAQRRPDRRANRGGEDRAAILHRDRH